MITRRGWIRAGRPYGTRLLLVGGVLVVVALTLVVWHRGHQPPVMMGGGLIEVEYTTANRSEQQTAARRCGVDEVADLTPTHIRYAVTPGQGRRTGDCLRRQGIVRVVAILG